MVAPSPPPPKSPRPRPAAVLDRRASMRRSLAAIHRRHDASDEAVRVPEDLPHNETPKPPPPRRHRVSRKHSRGSSEGSHPDVETETPSPPAGRKVVSPTVAAGALTPHPFTSRDRPPSPSDHRGQLRRDQAQQERGRRPPPPPPRLRRRDKFRERKDPASEPSKKFQRKDSSMSAGEARGMFLRLSEEGRSAWRLRSAQERFGGEVAEAFSELRRRTHKNLPQQSRKSIRSDANESRRKTHDGLPDRSEELHKSAPAIEAEGPPRGLRSEDSLPNGPKYEQPSAPPSPHPSQQYERRGFRDDYLLGESLRHPSHATRQPNLQGAFLAVASMRRHDFAFVRRSDGSYTYSILAYRSTEPVRRRAKDALGEEEACLFFVISDDGSTKMVRRRNWADCILLPAAEEHAPCPAEGGRHLDAMELCREVAAPGVHQEPGAGPEEYEYEDEDGWVPPDTVAFDREAARDETCSVISSVSDRARLLARRGWQ